MAARRRRSIGYGGSITEHVQVQEFTDVADELGRAASGLDDRPRREQYDVRGELEIELMLLQLRVMHHLLEAMRPTRDERRARPLTRP